MSVSCEVVNVTGVGYLGSGFGRSRIVASRMAALVCET